MGSLQLPATPESWSIALFLAVVVAVIVALITGVYFAAKAQAPGRARAITIRFGALYLLWLAIASAAEASGFIADAPMPRALVFLGLSTLLAVVAAMSPLGGLVARGLPLVALVGFQAFRLPLEVALHSWAESGAIPMTMTWSGANFDIISGFLALILAPLVPRAPVLARLFNVVGFAMLANVTRVAVLSTDLPFSWRVQPPLLVPLVFPYALIVPVCVAGALFGHIALTRRLFYATKP